jgi:carboxyl-terminal processing protease
MDRRNWPYRASCLLLLLTVACQKTESPTQPTGNSAGAVRAHLDQLINLMESGSFKRLTIDWRAFRARVFDAAANAQTIADSYPAIRVALEMLADGHTSYRSATGTVVFFQIRVCTAPAPPVPPLPPTIGYVKVARFSGGAGEAVDFANALRNVIAAADRDDLQGWIVDLRGNTGGNMWPMIAGVGPVLGEGRSGFFIDPGGPIMDFEYRDGASWLSGQPMQRVDAPYTLRRPQPRVAVLTDTGVASSGEATAIAFRQRPDTRSFGTLTCGLSTSTQLFNLSDGARLTLANTVMADRTRAPYGGQIEPDELVTDAARVVPRAVEWLQTGR